MNVFSSQKLKRVLILCICAINVITHAQLIDLQPPQDGTYIQDHAQLLDTEAINTIEALVKPLYNDSKIPIFVVTINSMADHNGQSMRIETFANILFDEWGIGFKELNNTSWNRGILLLISKNDRKARIELGADWTHQFDRQCQRIMDQNIVPHFKQGKYPKGILEGVKGLENMAQEFINPPPASDSKPIAVTPAPNTSTPTTRQSSTPIPKKVFQQINHTNRVSHNSSFSHHNQTASIFSALFPLFFIGIFIMIVFTAVSNGISGGGSSHRRRHNHFHDDDDHFHSSHNSFFDSSSSFDSGSRFGGHDSGSSGGGFSGGGGATGSW